MITRVYINKSTGTVVHTSVSQSNITEVCGDSVTLEGTKYRVIQIDKESFFEYSSVVVILYVDYESVFEDK